MIGHGVGATDRTLQDKKLKYPAHLIEHQLGYMVRVPLGRTYDRTTHLDERREMMQTWEDYLDDLKIIIFKHDYRNDANRGAENYLAPTNM